MKKEKRVFIGLLIGCILSGCGNRYDRSPEPTISSIVENIIDEENTTEPEIKPTVEDEKNIINDTGKQDEEQINNRLEASIINTRYAGEKLIVTDFLVKYIKEDGTTIHKKN